MTARNLHSFRPEKWTCKYITVENLQFARNFMLESIALEYRSKNVLVSREGGASASVSRASHLTSSHIMRKRKTSLVPSSPNDEFAIEICKLILKKGAESLNKSRHEARKVFTELIGFIFDSSCAVLFDYIALVQNARILSNLPKSNTCHREKNKEVCDRENRQLVSNVAEYYPLLTVTLIYDVEVFESESKRTKWAQGAEKKILIRKVNLLDVALKYALCYF